MNEQLPEGATVAVEPVVSAGCGYQGYEFGAGHYPDSICIGARLYDADYCDDDGNLYEPGEDMPCPMCKPKEAVSYWAERNRHCGKTKREAAALARSLVADIRKNRGVLHMRPLSANEQN